MVWEIKELPGDGQEKIFELTKSCQPIKGLEQKSSFMVGQKQ
jgi:hypothetical protein